MMFLMILGGSPPVIIRRPRGVQGVGRGLGRGVWGDSGSFQPPTFVRQRGDGAKLPGCVSGRRDLEVTLSATMAANGSHMRDQKRRKRSYLLGQSLPSRAGTTVSGSSSATFQLSKVQSVQQLFPSQKMKIKLTRILINIKCPLHFHGHGATAPLS